MDQTAKNQIEAIVGRLEKEGQRAAPVMEATQLATSQPQAVTDLAVAVMGRFPKGGTFLDAAFSFMPQMDWPAIVEHALETLERSPNGNEAAESVIAYASLQCPAALHEHLTRIFQLRPNAHSYYEMYPWRDSRGHHGNFLRTIVADRSASEEARSRGWRALLQTRHPALVESALAHAADIVLPDGWAERGAWIEAHLHLVGYHLGEGILYRTCSNPAYHLQFPEGFFDEGSRPPWLARVHPSWNLHPFLQTVRFGGNSTNECSLCQGSLHRMLAFNPVPLGVGVTDMPRLELATCLSCLGWETQRLFYRHDQVGSPVSIGHNGFPVHPEFPAGPLKEADIGLAGTPRRWYWQDWGLSNSRENLNRVGGEPSWIQDAEIPHCPLCGRVMAYLMQLDSDLPMQDGGEWLWGSGGIAYCFWCDHCKVSGFLWQCT